MNNEIHEAMLGRVAGRYGAPMGRRDLNSPGLDDPRKFYLKKARIDSGGYDEGGAYWGLGEPVCCALSPANDDDDAIRYYFRATSRDDAKRQTLERYPGALFFDGARGAVVPDGRYTIQLEFCGHETARYVVRFCGEWIGQTGILVDAEEMAADYHAQRMAAI